MKTRKAVDIVPVPSKIIHTLKRGSRVMTPQGDGTVEDILISLASWPSSGGYGLAPPRVLVQLDEPKEGQEALVFALQRLEIEGYGDIYWKPVQKLWPDQAVYEPSMQLRSKKSISQRLRALQGRAKD
jgi:hypothetical protein